jgi:hypothetical protein
VGDTRRKSSFILGIPGTNIRRCSVLAFVQTKCSAITTHFVGLVTMFSSPTDSTVEYVPEFVVFCIQSQVFKSFPVVTYFFPANTNMCSSFQPS